MCVKVKEVAEVNREV